MPARSSASQAPRPRSRPCGDTRTNADSMAMVPAVKRAPPGSIVPCIGRTYSLPVLRPGGGAAKRRTARPMTEDVIAARARALAGALTEAGFARLRVRDGDTEIELRRAPRAIPAAALASPVPAAAADTAERPAEPRGR